MSKPGNGRVEPATASNADHVGSSGSKHHNNQKAGIEHSSNVGLGHASNGFHGTADKAWADVSSDTTTRGALPPKDVSQIGSGIVIVVRVLPLSNVTGRFVMTSSMNLHEFRSAVYESTNVPEAAKFIQTIKAKIPKAFSVPNGELDYTRLIVKDHYDGFDDLKSKMKDLTDAGIAKEIEVHVSLKRSFSGELLGSKTAGKHGFSRSELNVRGLKAKKKANPDAKDTPQQLP